MVATSTGGTVTGRAHASRRRAPSTGSPPRASGCSRSRRDGGRIAFATTLPRIAVRRAPRAARAAADARPGGNGVRRRRSRRPFDERSRARGAAPLARPRRGGHRRAPLLGDDACAGLAAEELLFTLGHPDLVVADRTFAGHALACGLEVVAFAGLDALALAVAAWRGLAVRVVPLDERRPPGAYEPLVELLDQLHPGA